MDLIGIYIYIWLVVTGANVIVTFHILCVGIPIGSMYGIYANIGGILMVNVTVYSIHGSYGILGME